MNFLNSSYVALTKYPSAEDLNLTRNGGDVTRSNFVPNLTEIKQSPVELLKFSISRGDGLPGNPGCTPRGGGVEQTAPNLERTESSTIIAPDTILGNDMLPRFEMRAAQERVVYNTETKFHTF